MAEEHDLRMSQACVLGQEKTGLSQEVNGPSAGDQGWVREVGNEKRKEVDVKAEGLSRCLEPRAGHPRVCLAHVVSDGLLYWDRISESATLYPGWLYNIACKMIPTYCPFPRPSPGWTCPETPSTGPSTVEFPREGTIVAHK